MSVIFKGRIIAGKLVVDAVPTAGSTNPVSSQGIKAALDAKQNTLTFDQTPTTGSQNPVTSGGVKSALTHDLANIVATGSTNTTGAAIAVGTYFYLNGALVRAKANIDVNATFTSGTNYETVTAGGLNALNSALTPVTQSTGVTWGSQVTNTPTIEFTKIGNLVQLYVGGVVHNSIGNWTVFGTITDAGLIPRSTVVGWFVTSSGGTLRSMFIDAEGKMRLAGSSSDGNNTTLFITYII